MLIVANWKAYVEHLEKAKRLVLLGKKLSRNGSCSIVLAPPAPFLSILAAKNTSPVSFAVQDISATERAHRDCEIWSDLVADKPWGLLTLDGEYLPTTTTWNGRQNDPDDNYEVSIYRVGKKAAGRALDGRTWDEYPVQPEPTHELR
jgi:hypothetical protein